MKPTSFSPSRGAVRRGFTLTEILVTLGILVILSAILFPVVSRARESGRQSHCAGNLQNVYLATRQYREDFQGYPPTLEVLLPPGLIVASTLSDPDPYHKEVVGPPAAPVGAGGKLDGKSIHSFSLQNAVAYLKSTAEVVCPSDRVELNGFSSSYGAKVGSVWNFEGYNTKGFTIIDPPDSRGCVNPALPYDRRANPVKFSMSNRFASPGTIITHCIFHRTATSGLKDPYDLFKAGEGAGASDMVLRLDGTVKMRDVSSFAGAGESGKSSSASQWQVQTF